MLDVVVDEQHVMRCGNRDEAFESALRIIGYGQKPWADERDSVKIERASDGAWIVIPLDFPISSESHSIPTNPGIIVDGRGVPVDGYVDFTGDEPDSYHVVSGSAFLHPDWFVLEPVRDFLDGSSDTLFLYAMPLEMHDENGMPFEGDSGEDDGAGVICASSSVHALW